MFLTKLGLEHLPNELRVCWTAALGGNSQGQSSSLHCRWQDEIGPLSTHCVVHPNPACARGIDYLSVYLIAIRRCNNQYFVL